MGEPMLAANAS